MKKMKAEDLIKVLQISPKAEVQIQETGPNGKILITRGIDEIHITSELDEITLTVEQ